MSRPGHRRRTAAAPWLTAVVLALAASPLAAQQSDTLFTEIIVQLKIERGPERTLRTLGADSIVLVPLRQFLEMAEIRVTQVVPGRRVAGVLEPGDVPFWFDTQVGSRGRTGLTGTLTPRDAVWRDDELFVAAPLLGEILGVSFRMDWGDLSIVVVDAAALPVRRRLEREARRETVFAAASRGAGPVIPLARLPQPIADGAVLDYSLTVMSTNPADNLALATGFGAALIGGNLTYLGNVQRAAGATTRSGRTTWTRAWPEHRVVRQIRAGDTFLEGPRMRSVRGGVITNVPFLRPIDFGLDRFTGRLAPGWELEVMSAGRLLSYAQADSVGRYALPVPLAYGPNPVDVRAYGPSGEVFQWSRAFEIPFERLPVRRFEYLIGGGQCSADPCASLLMADARYGLTRRLTVRSGVEAFRRDTLADRWHPYAALAANLMPALLTTFEVTSRAVTSARALFSPTPDLRIDARQSWFVLSDDRALFGGSTDRRRTDATVFWRPGGGRLQLTGTGAWASGTSPRTTLGGGPSIRFSGGTLTLLAHRQKVLSSGVPLRTSGVDGSLNGLLGRHVPVLGRTLVTTLVRSSCTAELLSCVPRVSDWRVALGRQVGSRVRVDASVAWQRSPARTVFELSVVTSLPYLRSITRTGYSADPSYVSSQGFEGSVLWDRHGGRLRFDDGRSVGFAGIDGVVFRDANSNGVQDPEEGGVPEVLVRLGSRGVLTDSLGRFSSFELLPFERAIVEVDTLGLTDPTWVPASRAVAVRPMPNGYRFVPVALVEGQELSGMLTLDGRGLGQAPVLARNVATGEVVRMTTFDDGAFYVLSVRPGTYELTVPRDLLERLGAFFAPRTVEVRRGPQPPAIRLDLTSR